MFFIMCLASPVFSSSMDVGSGSSFGGSGLIRDLSRKIFADPDPDKKGGELNPDTDYIYRFLLVGQSLFII